MHETDYRGHCYWDAHGGVVPCHHHGKAAQEAADAYEAQVAGMDTRGTGRDYARMLAGARHYAWQRALECPMTPCDDGSLGLGWGSDD